MKKIILFLLVFKITGFYAMPKAQEIKELTNLVRIWGILKYIHPAGSRGDFNMNEEFVKQYEKSRMSMGESQFDKNMLDWIAAFDQKNSKYKFNQETEADIYVDYSWINQLDNQQLKDKLVEIIKNKNIGNQYVKIDKLTQYPTFKDESVDIQFDQTNPAHQLLFYSSFWNTMQYWNVNITLNDKKWNDVLESTICLFVDDKNNVSFEEMKDKLLAYVKDSHSDNIDISQRITEQSKYAAPFRGRIVNDSLVVTELFDPKKCELDGIALGDVIFKRDGLPLNDYIEEYYDIARSNDLYVRGRIEKWLLMTSNKNKIEISLVKKDSKDIEERTIHLYDEYFDFSQSETLYVNHIPLFSTITEEIGYINLSTISVKELKQAFKQFENTKGIIVDIRNYPIGVRNSEVVDFISTEKKQFIKILGPTLPGQRALVKKNILEFIAGDTSYLKDRKNGYKGILVILVDRNTVSKAEFIALQLQKAKNTYTIGEQTGGAVMNTKSYKLLNGQSFTFTNYMAVDPTDNSPLQRNGVKLNKKIEESALSFEPYSYLLEAVKYIENYQDE